MVETRTTALAQDQQRATRRCLALVSARIYGELKPMLNKKESQNIEWKQRWQDDHLKSICGFANAQGGRIYIGKDDKGRIAWLKNSQKLL